MTRLLPKKRRQKAMPKPKSAPLRRALRRFIFRFSSAAEQ
jgi:hypothetical protein